MTAISRLKYRWKRSRYAYSLFLSHFESTIVLISTILRTIKVVAAISCVVSLTLYLGYNLGLNDRHTLKLILRLCQGIFGISVIYDLFFRFKFILKNSRIIKWILDIALLITLLAWIYPNPQHPWIPWLKNILYSGKFLLTVLGCYSLMTISYALSYIPSRRSNPSILMASSFLIFIIIGSFVLMLPRCTYHGISYFDSLFVASSAVCITGLSSVDIPTTFTPFGILVLSVLVQLGSLGIITFTSFFAMFFSGSTSIYNQLLLKDMIYSKSMNSLVPTLLYVLGFTLMVEIMGAVCIYFTVPETLGLSISDRLMFSAFHSMSSFCNAGFSCLPQGMSNPALMASNQWIYIVTSILIFAGAIGFPILVNFKEIIRFHIKKIWNRINGEKQQMLPVHIFDLNTKVVLVTTLIILCIGTVGFFFLEQHNTLEGMDTTKQWVQSLFNALIPRSAGFSSVNPANFLNATLVLVIVQMIIGGSSQSMAGGIKVNTLGAMFLDLKAVLHGHAGASAFNRSISTASIRRANAVVILAAIALGIYTMAIMLLEPNLSGKAICFETVSALFTVGSSLGITSELCDASKGILCSAMFLGRVGIISLLCGFFGKPRDPSTHFPTDSIIIN